ncbi:MAG: hypothetical protein ACRC10_01285 [Thermoguttaceae bacterium]
MTVDNSSFQRFYTQIDVSNEPGKEIIAHHEPLLGEMCVLMRSMVAAQDRQNELLEELVGQISMVHRQRMFELAAWKQANPELAAYCKMAAEKLGKIQTDVLSTITEEVEDSYESFMDSEFMLGEFVDRFGPRFAHLNGLLQVLAQLGNAPDFPVAHPQSAK